VVLAEDSVAAVDDSTHENPGLLDDLYTLLRASRTPAAGEILQETISFVRHAGMSAENIDKLEEMRESIVALTVLAADVADHDGQRIKGAAATKQLARDLQQ
jgi:hypothetical protein